MEKVQVFIINFNGEHIVLKTIDSILSSVGIKPIIIVIDDHSEDDSNSLINYTYPEIEIIQQPVNTKNPNKLRNIALNRASTQYVLITDNDVVFENDCISQMLDLIKTDPLNATIAPRLMYMNEPNRIYLGSTKVHYIGAAIGKHRDENLGNIHLEVEHNSGGGIIFCDKNLLLKSGGFDEDLHFAWGDDGELYQRLLRYGYKCLYLPDAIAYHEHKPFTSKRHHRVYGQVYNRAVFMLSHYSLRTLLIIFPMIILYEIVQIGYFLIKGYIFMLFKGYALVFGNLKKVLLKRKKIQSGRKTSDKEVLFAEEIYMFKLHLKAGFNVKIFNAINSILNLYWRKIYKFLSFVLLMVDIG